MALIDKQGQPLTLEDFEASPSSEFHDGLAEMAEGSLYGYIDTAGAWVISPQFPETYPFSNGLAQVGWPGKHEWAYIDKQGKTVWKGTDTCKYPPF